MKLQGRIQDFFKEGVVRMRVQGKHPRAKGMGEGEGNVWICRFSSFWFQSKFVKFETPLLQCNNDSCLSLFLTAHLIKQTSLKEPSWMSHYKGLLAYLVYLAITARSENCSLGTVDQEQVLIHFISETGAQLLLLWSVGCRQWLEGERCSEKHLHSQHQMLIKGCLEALNISVDCQIVFRLRTSFPRDWEMECLSPRTACRLLHHRAPMPYLLWSMHETKHMAGAAIFVRQWWFGWLRSQEEE